ncbi:MAG: hypothetical protein WD646_13885 [Actinomycetota bacterium]
MLVAAMGAAVAYGVGTLRGGPDPGRLVYAGRQGVYIRDLDSGEERKAADLPKDVTFGMASSDAKWFAYASEQGALTLLDLESKQSFQVSEQLSVPLGWSPDGRLVAQELFDDRDIVLIDPNGGVRVIWSRGSLNVRFPVWLDSDLFAFFDEGNQRSLALVRLAESRSSVSQIGVGLPLAASPDGKEILIRRGKKLIVAKLEGRRLTAERTLFRGAIGNTAVSDQGFVAFTASGSGDGDGLWVLQSGEKKKKVLSEQVRWLEWTRDGSTILYSSRGAVYALTLPDGKPKRISKKGVDVFDVIGFTVVP